MPLFGPPSATPALHATTHKSGGTDVIKLNEFGAPTSQVDLGSQKIVNLAAPTLTTDAARLTDVPVAGTGASNFVAGNNPRLNPIPTAVKTTAYTAAAGELVLGDTSTASFAVTLPTAPTDRTRVGVKLVKSGATVNPLTVGRGGSTDVFDNTGGTTAITLNAVGESVTLQYIASSGVWIRESTSTPTATLDTRYLQANNMQLLMVSPTTWAGLSTTAANALYGVVQPNYLVQDSFTGTRTDTWTPSDSGASYTLSGTATDWQVNGGIGKVTLQTANVDRHATIATISAIEQDCILKWRLPVVPTANQAVIYIKMREVTSQVTYYRLRIQVTSAGAVTVQPLAYVSSVDTSLGSLFTMPSFTYTAGTWMWVHAQVTQTFPTTIRARVWQDGTTEPTTWQVSQQDSTSVLQAAAPTGLYFRTASGMTPVPFEFDVDEYSVS